MRKKFRRRSVFSAAAVLVCTVVAATALAAPSAKEVSFCRSLVNDRENQAFLKKFHEDSQKRFDGNGIRYGQEAQVYKDFKACAQHRDASTCWKTFNKTKIVTVLDMLDFYLASGAILSECVPIAMKPQQLSDQDLQDIVAYTNKAYPKTTPDGVRIERMSADRLKSGERALTFHKTVLGSTVEEFDLKRFASAEFQQQIREEACANPGTQQYLSSGISMRSVYRDKNNAYITEHVVHPRDCG